MEQKFSQIFKDPLCIIIVEISLWNIHMDIVVSTLISKVNTILQQSLLLQT